MRILPAVLVLLLCFVGQAFASEAGKRGTHVFMVLHRSGAGADEGFRDRLMQSGLDVRFTVRNIEGDYSLLPGIVDEIRAAKPDLVYAQSTIVAQAVAGTVDKDGGASPSGDIPVVFAMVADPIGSKLATRLDVPGRNVTGAVHVVSLAVQFNAMTSVRAVRKLGLIYNPSERTQINLHAELAALARDKGIELIAVDPLNAAGRPDPERLPDMVARLAAAKPDLVYIPPMNFLAEHGDIVTEELLRHGLPSFCAIETQIRTGGLMGLVAPFYNVGALAGDKAEAILRGKARPAEIPIETLSRFSFMLNLDAAKALDFYPPFSFLRIARFTRSGQ